MSLASSAKEAIVISAVAAGVMFSGSSLVKAGEVMDHSNDLQPIKTSSSIRYGHTGHTVTILQEKLAKMALYQGRIDGIFGKETENAVKQLQRIYHLKVDGVVNEKTLLKLRTANPDISELSIGVENERVLTFQTKLKALNYYNGSADGIFGPLTLAAVKEYQMKNNLDATGKIDAPTQIHIATNRNIKGKTLQTVKVNTAQSTKVQSSVVSIAKTFVGANYVWGGTTPSGFDCSGFIRYVFNQANVFIPRTVNEIWNFSKPVQKVGIGDVVFFETYKPGPSHAGIYLGNGEFIHTSSSKGVTISHLSDHYWKERYIGARKIPVQ